MNTVFQARNLLQKLVPNDFSTHLCQINHLLNQYDYSNLLQHSFNLYQKQLLIYIKIFHKYFTNIIFSSIQNKKKKLCLLQYFAVFGKAHQFKEFVSIDSRIINDFNVKTINCVISNVNTFNNDTNSKQSYEIIEFILHKRPHILMEKINNDRDNPLIQAILNQLYDVAILLLKYSSFILPNINCQSNQFHYLFKNGRKKMDKHRLLQLIRMLCEKGVNIYQTNTLNKPAIYYCHHQIRQEVEQIYKATNSSQKKSSQKASRNSKKHSQKSQRVEKQQAYDRYDQKYTICYSRQQEYEGVQSVRPSYKHKVKSQFGGKDFIKQNNQVVRQNLSPNPNHSSSMPFHPNESKVQGHPLIFLNQKELPKKAANIHERLTNKKEQQFVQLKKNQQVPAKPSMVLSNKELAPFMKEQIITVTKKIKDQNAKQKEKFNSLIKQITKQLQDMFPITIGLFGSFATDLHLIQSDIDLVVLMKQGSNLSSRYLFEQINHKLEQMTSLIASAVYLDKASIPIIKATCTQQYNHKHIDISFLDNQHNGLYSVPLIHDYLRLYPQLENLILVLKTFIYRSKLFAPYSGGLSSYGLVLMIVAFVQTQNKLNPPQPNYDIDLRVAQLLISFLKFYGYQVDYTTQQLIVAHPDDPNIHYQKCNIYNPQWAQQYPAQPKLIILDPLWADNNVGKPTRRIKQIQMAFELAYITIHTNIRCKQKKQCKSYQKIKQILVNDARYQGNKRPCCILERMFKSTDMFDLAQF